jgi:hypothetical protein
MNIHNRQRTIYLARAGEALIEHLYKADADLSSLGWEYADELCAFVENIRNTRAQKSIRARIGTRRSWTTVGGGFADEREVLEMLLTTSLPFSF